MGEYAIMTMCSADTNRFFSGHLGQSEAIRVEHTRVAIKAI